MPRARLRLRLRVQIVSIAPSAAANDNGWFFDTPAASGHLLTCGII
ncbi:hypothetical protein [Microcystis phage Mwe-JY08]